ncbi:hypothetical protein ABXS75_01565 [Roseburia hominis]
MIGENSLRKRVLKLDQHSGLAQNQVVTYSDLGSASLYGDICAQTVIHDIAGDFSNALRNLICLVRPKIVIIGGKSKNLGPLFLEEVKKNLNTTGFRQIIDSMDPIRYSMLDSAAYYIGAMKYFFDIHYDFTQNLFDSFFIG